MIGGHDDDTAELRMQLRGYITSGGGVSDGEDPTEVEPDKLAIADHLFRNLRGQDNLVFANSRANVETYADLLKSISDRARVPNEFFPTTATCPRTSAKTLSPGYGLPGHQQRPSVPPHSRWASI